MSKELERFIAEFDECSHPTYRLLESTDLISLKEIWPDEFKQHIYIEGTWGKQCTKCNQIFEVDKSINNIRYKIHHLNEILGKGNISLHFGRGDITLSQVENNQKYPPSIKSELFSARKSRYTLEKDVILSTEVISLLRSAIIKLQYRDLIYDDWGFSKVDPLGNGAIFNFHGPPGTGKTRTAEALAGELDLAFLNVDYGSLISKYHGETSKNIEFAFQDAVKQNALIFFDEADAVLSRRSKSSSQSLNQETNLSKSTFLKQLEQYDGVCVFATNEPSMYDEAFKRRLAFDVEFKLPDIEQRKKIWDFHLVEKIPLEENRGEIIESVAIASEQFSGGDILKAMRQALPKAILVNPNAPKLSKQHLIEAIDKIRMDNKPVDILLSDRQKISKSLLNS